MDTIKIYEDKHKDELILDLLTDTTISIYNTNLKCIKVTTTDNIKVHINEFNNTNCNDLKIIFNINSNSSINYNLSNVVKKDNRLNIIINYLGNNSKVETKIHSLVSGNELIKIDGIVKNNSKDNELLEDIKIMLLDKGKCEVIPNMLIDTNQVTANHKVAVSNIRTDELFYLMGKGLSLDSSINLVKKSFLISIIKDKELNNKINNNF